MRKRMIIFMILCLLPANVFSLTVSSQSACLMDMDSGRVLFAKSKDNPRLIASITKIMTAILAIESGKLDEEVTVGEEVLKMYGSNIYIELNEKMTLRDLIYGLLLRSGNDAAIVISVFIGGTEENFVKMMNQKAKMIGMKNTVFNNPHGLDEETENKSTAYDMALLSSYANQNKIYREISSTKKYQTQSDKKSYLWYNRNKLLTLYDKATGGKTGYTPRAGRTLVTTATNKKLNLTVVTLNDGNEYDTHEQLYEYGFNNYNNYRILNKKKFKIDQAYYPNQIYIKEDFSYPLTEEEKEEIKVEVKLTKLNEYKNNDKVGIVTVKLKNNKIHTQNIYVKKSKQKTTWWNKIWSFINGQ